MKALAILLLAVALRGQTTSEYLKVGEGSTYFTAFDGCNTRVCDIDGKCHATANHCGPVKSTDEKIGGTANTIKFRSGSGCGNDPCVSTSGTLYPSGDDPKLQVGHTSYRLTKQTVRAIYHEDFDYIDGVMTIRGKMQIVDRTNEASAQSLPAAKKVEKK